MPVSNFGVNPRGLRPNHLWQMDVIHEPSFGTVKYIHTSVDTCSGFIFATTHAGEKTKHVISHCLQTFATMGIPKLLKTDNGLAYTSQTFAQFCSKFSIVHKTGIPYNPQGQAIVECPHQTLKNIIKQKGETARTTPKDKLNLALFTLNFLILDTEGRSIGGQHWNTTNRPKPSIMWKDVLMGTWKGPDPVLIWGQGSVCIFP